MEGLDADNPWISAQEEKRAVDKAVRQSPATHSPSSHCGGDLFSAVLGITKGLIGPAILYLPHGLAKAGYATAVPIMLLVTFLFLYSCQCLLDGWRLEHDALLHQLHEAEGTFPETPSTSIASDMSEESERTLLLSTKARIVFPYHKRTFHLSYPELARRAYGAPFEKLVKLGITLMQSCVCLTYLIFVPQNLCKAFHVIWGVVVAPVWFLFAMVAIQVPLSFIQDIRKLTATNLFANLLIFYGWAVCVVLALREVTSSHGVLSPIESVLERFADLSPFGSDWFMFIGTSVFMFEGSITVLVPLQEAVFSEADRERFPAVNRNTILCIVAFYVCFSLTCWMALGDNVQTVLTTSLPSGPAATSVQLAYSVAVIFTFPLQNYPALEIASRSVALAVKKWRAGATGTRHNQVLQHNVTGTVLVVLLAVVAVTTMDKLDKVVSFLGGLLGCPVAFIFPPLIHLRLAGRSGGFSHQRMVLNVLVAAVGCLAMILSTTTSLM